MFTKEFIAELETQATCYCPSCGKRINKMSNDGGRCINCYSSLCAVFRDKLPTFTVTVGNETFEMRAENEKTIGGALRWLRKQLKDAEIQPN